MRGIAVIGLFVLVLVFPLTAGCNSYAGGTAQLTSEELFFQELRSSTQRIADSLDDVDAQTRENEKIKSLRELIKITKEDIKKISRINTGIHDLEVIKYYYLDILNEIQSYATYEISYQETGDLNDRDEAEGKYLVSTLYMKGINKLIREYNEKKAQEIMEETNNGD